MLTVPVGAGPLGAWLEPFAAALGEATWRRALVMVAGALRAPGRRTVAATLRAAGLGHAPGFAGYHRVCEPPRIRRRLRTLRRWSHDEEDLEPIFT